MKLYILRHGETEWNAIGKSQGHLNSDLTENGVDQAEKLGAKLKNIEFDKVFVSPLGRTRQTSELLMKYHDTKIEYLDEIREINLGAWQGMVKKDIEEQFGDEYDRYRYDPENFVSIGGESFYQLKARVQQGLDKITKSDATGNVLVVTHGITKKMMMAIFNNVEIKEFWETPWMKPTSLSVVNYSNGAYNVEMCADTSHYE